MIRVLCVIALFIHACLGVTVTQRPANTAVEVGQNATIACIVTNKGATENVQWKVKTNASDTYNAITFNENVLTSPKKYAVVGTYNLTVINAASTDQGTYRCTAGTSDNDAYLTVADLPDSVAIAWSGTPDAGTTVNLTCTATNGHPTPFLRWMFNGVDLTHQAFLEYGSVSSSGYGNSISNLPLALSSNLNGGVMTCYVAYDGWQDAMNATYVLNINGSRGLQMSGVIMALIAFAAALL